MSGNDDDLSDLLGPEPVDPDPDAPAPEVLVDEAPAPKQLKSNTAGAASGGV